MAAETKTGRAERLRVLLLGAGSLGRAFLRYVRDRGGPFDVVGIATAHHGRIVKKEGIDPSFAINSVESEGFGNQGPTELRQMIEAGEPNIIIDCVPQNIRSGEPSLTNIRTALDLGLDVVTANKSAVVLGYRDFLHRAAKSKAQFRFSATLLDGLPIGSVLERYRGAKVVSARGVLNGTSSLVLESVQLGSTRSRGLARAQAQGIAEADAVLDLDGWDAAAKAALFANVWMGGALRVVDVVRTGCEAVKDETLREVADRQHYRLVAELSRVGDGAVRATVQPTGLEPNDPLFSLKGCAGGITIELDTGSKFTMLQESHGLDDCAFAIVQDCLSILAGEP